MSMWQDWFVGAASATIGGLFWYWALFNSEAGNRLKMAQFFSKTYGPTAGRIFYAMMGTTLIALGAAIASGYSLALIGKSNGRMPPVEVALRGIL